MDAANTDCIPGSFGWRLRVVVSDAAHYFICTDNIGRLGFYPLGHRIRPLEVYPALSLLETHLHDQGVRLLAVWVFDMQQIPADKRGIAAMRLVHPVAVVAEDV